VRYWGILTIPKTTIFKILIYIDFLTSAKTLVKTWV